MYDVGCAYAYRNFFFLSHFVHLRKIFGFGDQTVQKQNKKPNDKNGQKQYDECIIILVVLAGGGCWCWIAKYNFH